MNTFCHYHLLLHYTTSI